MINDNIMYKSVEKCPWCGSKLFKELYAIKDGGVAKRCNACSLVYSSIVLSEYGLTNYWSTYETKVHMNDIELSNQRRKMYVIEHDLICRYIPANADILDVGCSNGDFLDFFKNDGHTCEGTEFGEDAFNQASKKFKVYRGDIGEIEFEHQYDLIIFRGVIQYLLHPKEDLLKAIRLLKNNGLIFITSSPNSESICHKLFKNKFRLPLNPTNYYMFNEKLITDFMTQNGMKLYLNEQLYLDTPYENVETDIIAIARAVEKNKNGELLQDISPAFFDNMLTLVYKRISE